MTTVAAWPTRQLRRVLAKSSVAAGIDSALLGRSIFLLATTVVGQGASFLVQILVANRIGVEAYGVYAYAWTWAPSLALLALMGNDRLILRYASEYRSRGEPGLLRRLVGWTARGSLGASIGLALCFLAYALAFGGPTLTASAAVWAAAVVPVLVAAALVENLLWAHDLHHWANLPSRVLRPVLMGGMFLVASAFLVPEPGAGTAAAANALAVLVSVAIAAVPLAWTIPPATAGERVSTPPGWRGTSIAFGINAIALHLNVILDMLVLGLFHDAAVVGVYGAVSRYAVIMCLASVAVNTIIQPMIVRALNERRGDDLQALVTGASRLIGVIVVGFALPLVVFAEPLLAIFGPGFEDGAWALRITVVGLFAVSLISVSGAVLGMTGHEKQATAVMVAGCLLTLCANLAVVPTWGIPGAAIATTLSRLVWNVALFELARRRVGVVCAPFSFRRGGSR